MSLLDIFKPQYNVYLTQQKYSEHIYNLPIADFYKTQPHLRTVVSFISENLAQLPMNVYSKTANGYELDTASQLYKLLQHPNDEQSQYDLMLQTISEYKLYGNAYWYVSYGKQQLWEIHVLPNRLIQAVEKDGAWNFSGIRINGVTIPWKYIVHFHNYNTDNQSGLSPVETLKDILAEQSQAWRFRKDLWHNRGIFNEYITRDKDVEPLTLETANRFTENFSKAWRNKSAGRIPLLEDGMKLNTAQFNSREAQWLEIAQLSLDTVASAYHINSALVGGSHSNATYASAKEHARALYSEALAPDIKMLASKINSKLLRILNVDPNTHYVDFDITAKLEASFTDMADSIVKLVSNGVMEVAEGREKLKLSHIDNTDILLLPLNMSVLDAETGANSTLLSTYKSAKSASVSVKEENADNEEEQVPEQRKPYTSKHTEELAVAILAFLQRQENSLASKWGAGKREFDKERWNKELAQAIAPFFGYIELEAIEHALAALPDEAKYSQERTAAYISSMAERRASAINASTEQALEDIEDAKGVHEYYSGAGARAAILAGAAITAIANFVKIEAVKQNEGLLQDLAGGKNIAIYKTWYTTSGNPRPTHAAQDGQTVPIDEPFANGGMFPGDAALPASEVVNCMCIIDITIEEE